MRAGPVFRRGPGHASSCWGSCASQVRGARGRQLWYPWRRARLDPRAQALCRVADLRCRLDRAIQHPDRLHAVAGVHDERRGCRQGVQLIGERQEPLSLLAPRPALPSSGSTSAQTAAISVMSSFLGFLRCPGAVGLIVNVAGAVLRPDPGPGLARVGAVKGRRDGRPIGHDPDESDVAIGRKCSRNVARCFILAHPQLLGDPLDLRHLAIGQDQKFAPAAELLVEIGAERLFRQPSVHRCAMPR